MAMHTEDILKQKMLRFQVSYVVRINSVKNLKNDIYLPSFSVVSLLNVLNYQTLQTVILLQPVLPFVGCTKYTQANHSSVKLSLAFHFQFLLAYRIDIYLSELLVVILFD